MLAETHWSYEVRLDDQKSLVLLQGLQMHHYSNLLSHTDTSNL